MQMMLLNKLRTLLKYLITFVFGMLVMWIIRIADQDRKSITPEQGQRSEIEVSPDKNHTSIVWLPDIGGLGATISQPYQVWIENKNGESRLVLEADKTDGVKIKWHNARHLEICYSDAQISKFSNRFIDIDHINSEIEIHFIEVTLRHVMQLDECRL
jgi:hypothetical protein